MKLYDTNDDGVIDKAEFFLMILKASTEKDPQFWNPKFGHEPTKTDD